MFQMYYGLKESKLVIILKKYISSERLKTLFGGY